MLSTMRPVRPVLTAEEYRRVDKAYEGDLIEAMDRAGHAVALAAVRAGAQYGRRVVVLAGPGNNGGDGYVAARYLKTRGVPVMVLALGEPKTPEAIDAAERARATGVPVSPMAPPQPGESDAILIDALFGGGARRGLPDLAVRWMGEPGPVVAVDYPTGLDPDTGDVTDRAFRATETVTFGSLKTGHVRKDGPDYCGKVTVADIGIEGGEPSMFVAEAADAPRPARSRIAHKWSAGAVLIVGGSTGLLGAAVYAGLSALNFGAGSVQVASANAGNVHQLAPQLPCFDSADAVERLHRFDVVVAGPGLADDDASGALEVLARASRVVLDAGGLRPDLVEAALTGDGEVIVTPHSGEFPRIAGSGPGAFAARSYAGSKGLIVLLKGNPTVITDGGPPVLVDAGGPELASIGTGDVLAGMIGALWARGLSPVTAAVSAAYWHGVAGADLHRRGTVTAELLLGHIPAFAW